MALGILGGTFDPIHYGHLRSAQEVRGALRLQELRLIPAAQPPHRPAPHTSAAHRLRMLEIALVEFPGLAIDDRELKRAGPSYTVDTLASLRSDRREEAVCLLLGADAFVGFESWHQWRRIPELAHLVVMTRPGSEETEIPDWARARRCAREELSARPAGCVWRQAVTPLAISSSDVRARLARGESVAGWLPPAVLEYIEAQGLYR